ncbi:RNA polymerase sigma factor [Shouchella hunanensis]|uniref:Sigma-70 family RNA polymerase sigma factor n=1 Tax=Shouchella hunanensis TaxID=766894 RepID=A0ABY7W9W4_9BACI|nr:sigma-70 family RNA polymerase sigma factor [Shouchella hunanensis]WDF05244.1 sigma-70 family RNA polymerase sigma factor [Shouchella hunanensis]
MEKLVKRAKKGDGEAFVTLVKQYEEVLYKTAKRIVKEDEDIADVLQDTMMTAFEKLHKLKKSEYLHTWLFRILLNKCASLTKKKQTQAAVDLNDYLMKPAKNQYSDIEFKDAVNSLREEQRNIFTLYYAVGYTTKEISQLLNQSEGTIKSHLSRGRAELKKHYYEIGKGVQNHGQITKSC